MSLKFAKSLCGHDKDYIYVIYKEDEKFVYLVNGQNKTIDKPKKKKQKHIQMIKHLPDEITSLSNEKELSDETVKKMIQIYLRSIQCQKQM